MEIIEKSIFMSPSKYIVHQCNCVTNYAAHLAFSIFKQFPYADIYTNRTKPDQPGTIIIRGDGIQQRYVVSLLGQYFPGKPKYPTSIKDGFDVRKLYFKKSLLELAKVPDLESVSFPYGIGCGAAGGDWSAYLEMIEDFNNSVKSNAIVSVYKLKD
jgi:hypothetical protein